MSWEIKQQLLLWNAQWLRSSLTCWWLSQRRFMPCLIQPCRRVTSKPWQPSVTWQTGNWWWSLAGQSTSQVNEELQECKHEQQRELLFILCFTVLSSTRIFTYSSGWKLTVTENCLCCTLIGNKLQYSLWCRGINWWLHVCVPRDYAEVFEMIL